MGIVAAFDHRLEDGVGPGAGNPQERLRLAAERDRLAAARDRDAASIDALAAERTDDDPDRAAGLMFEAARLRFAAACERFAAARERYDAAADRYLGYGDIRRARFDQLTGALQRGAGRELLRHEIDRARRGGGRLVVAFVDVVGLKTLNDHHGHAAGDEALARVVKSLQHGLRSYDIVVRYGGDEFVCGIVDADLDDARRRVTEVRAMLTEGQPTVVIAVGLAQLQPDDSLDDVVRRADAAMYEERLGRSGRSARSAAAISAPWST